MPHDNQSERLRIFRRDVIRERYVMPWWSLPLHGLWTAVVSNVMLWILLIALFGGFELIYGIVNICHGRPININARIETYGIAAGILCGVFALATFPMCVIAASINVRPRLILAGRGKLVIRHRTKRIIAPLSECQWKPGRLWSMDHVGAIYRRQPFLVLTWIPTPSESERAPRIRVIFVGLTESTYRRWQRLIAKEHIPRSSWRISLRVIVGIIVGGAIGSLAAAVVSPLIRLALGPIAGFGSMVLSVIDGLVIGGITRYVACGELRLVRGYIKSLGSSVPLLFAAVFALAAARLFRGTGLPQIAAMAIFNGVVGFAFGWNLQRVYEKRIRDEETTTSFQSQEVSTKEP